MNHNANNKIATKTSYIGETLNADKIKSKKNKEELTDLSSNSKVDEISFVLEDCNIKMQYTDSLNFHDAFTYFRRCLGSNNQFSWKGQLYTTLLAKETITSIVETHDSTNIKSIIKEVPEELVTY